MAKTKHRRRLRLTSGYWPDQLIFGVFAALSLVSFLRACLQ